MVTQTRKNVEGDLGEMMGTLLAVDLQEQLKDSALIA